MSIFTELISGLVGAVIGGLFTLVGAHYEVKRQLEHQKTLDAENELQANIKALKSIRMEITHNINQAKMSSDFLLSKNINKINYTEINMTSNFHLERWRRHSDTIGMIDFPETIDKIDDFYSIIFLIQSTNSITQSTVNTIQSKGAKVINLIDKNVIEIQQSEIQSK